MRAGLVWAELVRRREEKEAEEEKQSAADGMRSKHKNPTQSCRGMRKHYWKDSISGVIWIRAEQELFSYS